jgi:23S rRNA pseudouridine1911/1915/1917 synthase
MSLYGIAIASGHQGVRLDLFLARRLAELEPREVWSRSAIQRLIAAGQVTLNGRTTKTSARLKTGDWIEVVSLPPRATSLEPEPLPLDVLYEDEDCLVLNKPPGIAVHPGAGRQTGTLVNALLHRCPKLVGVGGDRRPGIVHRLDRDTSGVMVVAKTGHAFHDLVSQFKERAVKKEYVAVVWGKLTGAKGVIDRPIGRHRSNRKKMSSVRPTARSREALTEWQVTDAFGVARQGERRCWVSVVRLKPRTGRTHQLRVHLAEMGHPIVGDRVYGSKARLCAEGSGDLRPLIDFPRQALHAERLAFRHPRLKRKMEFHAPLWRDMGALLATFEALRGHPNGKLEKGG